jgi:hypothetical protein
MMLILLLNIKHLFKAFYVAPLVYCFFLSKKRLGNRENDCHLPLPNIQAAKAIIIQTSQVNSLVDRLSNISSIDVSIGVMFI